MTVSETVDATVTVFAPSVPDNGVAIVPFQAVPLTAEEPLDPSGLDADAVTGSGATVTSVVVTTFFDFTVELPVPQKLFPLLQEL